MIIIIIIITWKVELTWKVEQVSMSLSSKSLGMPSSIVETDRDSEDGQLLSNPDSSSGSSSPEVIEASMGRWLVLLPTPPPSEGNNFQAYSRTSIDRQTASTYIKVGRDSLNE